MVYTKNYETVTTFVKVMQKNLWPPFSGHCVYLFWVTRLQVRPLDGFSRAMA